VIELSRTTGAFVAALVLTAGIIAVVGVLALGEVEGTHHYGQIASAPGASTASTNASATAAVLNTEHASSTTSGSTWFNRSAGFRTDFANVPHHVFKEVNSWMTIRSWVTNPEAVFGMITTPDNVTLPMNELILANGTVDLSLTFGQDFPSGQYTVLITVTKGPTTSLTWVSVEESPLSEPVPLPALVP
jgi:hypothetical protein